MKPKSLTKTTLDMNIEKFITKKFRQLEKTLEKLRNDDKIGIANDAEYHDKPAVWVTIKGNHIPLDEGGQPLAGNENLKKHISANAKPAKEILHSRATSKQSSASGAKTTKKPKAAKATKANFSLPATSSGLTSKQKAILPKSAQGKEFPIFKGALVIDTPEARIMVSAIKAGYNYTKEELLNSPVFSQFEVESAKWDKKFPRGTVAINTPEREKLRANTTSKFVERGSWSGAIERPDGTKEDIYDGEVAKEYKATIVIGLPAAGKSSVVVNHMSKENHCFVFDSDELKKMLPEFKESKGMAANAVHGESKKMLSAALKEFTTGSRKGDNLIIPIIGDDYGKICKEYLSELEKAPYKIDFVLKDADAATSMNRVTARAAEEGRIIPADVVTKYEDKPYDVYKKVRDEKKYPTTYYDDNQKPMKRR